MSSHQKMPKPDIAKLAKDWLCLIETDKGPRITLEPVGSRVCDIPTEAVLALGKRVTDMNAAADEGILKFTPGLCTVQMVEPKAALNVLAPGALNFESLAARESLLGIGLFALVKGQWIPPGVRLDLTAAETQTLIDLLALGGLAAIEAALVSWGLAAKVAVPVAAALLLAALEILILKAISPIGAVGIKITLLPAPLIIPFPRF